MSTIVVRINFLRFIYFRVLQTYIQQRQQDCSDKHVFVQGASVIRQALYSEAKEQPYIGIDDPRLALLRGESNSSVCSSDLGIEWMT